MNKTFSYLKKGYQYFPVIEIKLKKSRKELTVKALVDSGASFSIFRPEIADYLGIVIEQGKPTYLTGIGGRILGYFHKIPIEVGKKKFVLDLVFSKEFTVSFNILGRNNFFVPFLITFDEKFRKTKLSDNQKI